MAPWRQKLSQAGSWVGCIYREFRAEHANLSAAAIALFALLSLFPLLLLAISLASYALGGPEEAMRRINALLAQVLVGGAGAAVSSTLRGVIEARGTAGLLGLLGFLWAGSRVFTILAQAFNMAWDVTESRGFLRLNLLALGLVLLSFTFGVVMLLGPLAVGFLLRHSDRLAALLGVPIRIGGTLPILVSLLAYVAAVGLFFILYKWVPNRPVPWQSALLGAVVAATLWEVARYLFQLYVVNFASYNEVYGALAGVIILILWLYYSAMIVLAGTLTAVVHASRVYGEQREPRQRRGYDGRAHEAA